MTATRKEIRDALARVPTRTEHETFLSGAAQTARLQLTDEERAQLDVQVKKLKTIKGVGENTALELLAAIGRLLDKEAENESETG